LSVSIPRDVPGEVWMFYIKRFSIQVFIIKVFAFRVIIKRFSIQIFIVVTFRVVVSITKNTIFCEQNTRVMSSRRDG
jgi:hypothetical protein